VIKHNVTHLATIHMSRYKLKHNLKTTRQ